jgi:EAL domain-containing protein (putative c-di-GMP-specific phosphodiesterase class I)
MNGTTGPGATLTEERLRDAIEGRVLHLYYQPIVSLADRSSTLLEALPRWPVGPGEVLGPAEFLDLARRGDLLGGLERWGIRTAFDQLARWNSGVSAEMCVSLNLSEQNVFESDIAKAVADASAATGASPDRIQFEISELALVDAGGRSLAKLRALADLGVSLTIDGFTGAAPSDRLRELPVGALKIGRDIVAGIPDDEASLRAAAAAVELARELELTVIATGVENPGQLASLRDMGFDCAQGFFFSVPMPPEVLEERMLPR